MNIFLKYINMSITFPIQMYDPKREYRTHKKEFDDSIQKVLNHGLFINGPAFSKF